MTGGERVQGHDPLPLYAARAIRTAHPELDPTTALLYATHAVRAVDDWHDGHAETALQTLEADHEEGRDCDCD